MGKIADISKYQGNVDWNAARNELDFVILRASCGNAIDSKYLQNAAACGLPFGVYHYVKAGTAEAARTEARFFVGCVRQGDVQPCFYIADIEYEAQTHDTTEAVCVAFLDELRMLGCEKIGLYINTRYKWAGEAIGMCDIMWIPHWGKNDGNVPEDKYKSSNPHDLWQYTSRGTLAGVKGHVDLNQLTGTKPLSYFIAGAEGKAPESEGSEKDMLTNIQLAEFCLKAFAAQWVYWYGTYGNPCTQSRYASKAKQYPKHYTSSRNAAYMKDIAEGRTCADCCGLIKAFFWMGGDVDAAPKYASNNCPDKGADSMFALCKETGAISTIPDIPGLVVWKSGHIGVYVGNGYTVEMKGFDYDCVKAKVTDGKWTKWGKLPTTMLAYDTDGSVAAPEEPKQPSETVSPDAGNGQKTVVVKSNGGKVNIRLGNGTEYGRVAQLSPGTMLPYVATAGNGWNAVRYGKQVAWISGQYSEVRGGVIPMTNEELTQRAIELDERVTRHTEQIKTCFNQIAETRSMAESVHKLATSVELLAHEQKSTKDKVDDLTRDVEEIKDKPAKRWDSAATVVITVILTAIVTLILSRIGL